MNKIKKMAIALAVTPFILTGFKSSFATTGKVTVTTVRVRTSASTESEILDRASNGEEVEVLGTEGDWYKVKFKEKEGYIHKDYLQVDENVDTAENTSEETNETTENNEDVQENNAQPEEEKTQEEPQKVMELGDTINKETVAYLLPNFTSTRILTLEQGKQIKVNTTMANWVKIEVDSKDAWVPKTFLMREVENTTQTEETTENANNENEEQEQKEEKQDETQVEQEKQEEVKEQPVDKAGYISSSASANLRSGPSTSTDSIGKLSRNTKIQITADAGDWYKVSYNGKTGYIYKQLITEGEPPAETSSRSQDEPRTANTTSNDATQTASATPAPATTTTASVSSGSVVDVAKQYVGSKYVYGGSSPSGFDCSGFTSYVYGKCGTSLSRTSYAQATQGTAVDKANLQAGDLLLFTTNGSGGGISHVGIYVGNGQFIHAANPSKGVVYDSINSGYYATNYAGARRVQ